ncbi:MAG: hypothetical protein Q8R30_04210 [bacterium]|nr:hypothetical protein [bacterium]MDZ4285301.1 hypothetical protein [Candidatus Sungbacteria bacterium]
MEPTDVRVEVKSEDPVSCLPARVLIYQGEKLIREIVAHVDMKRGADYRYYPCVILEERPVPA